MSDSPIMPPSTRGAEPASPILALTCVMAPGRADALAEAVLARSRARGRGLRTVILDLAEGDGLDETCCAALRALTERLGSRGARLRLVVTSPEGRQQCLGSGLADCLGADAIHGTLRSALLSAYASLPGPGLVTGPGRAALTMPAEPLRLPAGP